MHCNTGNMCYVYRIDGSNVIKVADFGLSEDMYCSNYFRRNSEDSVARDERLPIRWMAPESIENDRFDESTDVVSYTVNHTTLCIVIPLTVCVRGYSIQIL